MSGAAKDIFFFGLFLVVIPAVVFLVVRGAKMSARIGLTFVVLVLGLFVLPNFVRTRMVVSQNACVNNLNWIQKAKTNWAEANHKGIHDVPTADELFNETNGLPVSRMLTCPAGGAYIIGAVGDETKCTIGPPLHTLHPQNVVYQ